MVRIASDDIHGGRLRSQVKGGSCANSARKKKSLPEIVTQKESTGRGGIWKKESFCS